MSSSISAHAGTSLIEVLLAVSLFMLIAGGLTTLVLQGLDTTRQAEEYFIAQEYAQQGLEGIRTLQTDTFSALSTQTNGGVEIASGTWQLTSSPTMFDKYTRAISIEPVARDGSGAIVSSGGTIDPATKKVLSTVTWQYSPGNQKQLSFSTYFTDFTVPITGNFSWSNPQLVTAADSTQVSSLDKLAYQEPYLYATSTSGTAEILVIDMTDPALPQVVGSTSISGSPTNIAVAGNYAYISSDHNTAELVIIDISDPSTPQQVGTFNSPGAQNATAVAVNGTTVYLVHRSSTTDLLSIDVSNPTNPTQLDTANLNGNMTDVIYADNKVFVTSTGIEVYIYDVTTPSSLNQLAALNLSGGQNAQTVAYMQQDLAIGRSNGIIEILSITNPSSPTSIGTIDVGARINGLAFVASLSTVLSGANTNNGEFKAVDVTSTSSPTELGSYNATTEIYDIAYDYTRNLVFASQSNASGELLVLEPGPL